jgi:ABC-type bacteriocin/lantibiotic exporter with double-glycine peptidase domain
LRSRVVALKGKWWTDGNAAPLVAFRDKDNSPVALLPAKGKGYELFDPADLRTTKVSATVALTLNGFAHTFYRRLPNEKLGASALLSYGLRDSQRELSAILLMGIGSGVLSLGTPVATGILFNSIIPGAQRSQLLLMAAFLFSG